MGVGHNCTPAVVVPSVVSDHLVVDRVRVVDARHVDSESPEPWKGVTVGWVWVLTAVDVQQVGGGVAVLGGVTIAVLSTLRYIKRTEDDVVDNLRVEIKRLEAQVADARAEVASVQAESKIEIAAVRRQNARLHHQVETLVRLMRESGVAIPEDFWA
jgi:hypothetical protein